jgi:HEAT repeat protein
MGLKRQTPASELHPVTPRDYARDVAGLIAQMSDAEAAVRRWAVRDLGSHPAAAAALGARLVVETDSSVRSALFSSLSRVGGDDVVRAVLPLLRSEDPELRNGVIEVLSGMPDAVAPHIDALLCDGDSDVRIFTVNLLGDLNHVRVVSWLERVLMQDAAVNVVGAALEVLAEVGTAGSLPALRAVVQRFPDDAFIGFAVDVAVERIGTS